MNSIPEAVGLVCAMGAAILFCRAFPFLFFSGKEGHDPEDGNAESGNAEGVNTEDGNVEGGNAENGNTEAKTKGSSKKKVFLDFVEKTVPPAAMTVLAFNALGSSFRDNPRDGLMVLAASIFTAIVHVWKRNPLISIFGGTAVYMVLLRFL